MSEGWLTGWKEIANHVGLHIRTCKRYKKKYSLPVHYLPGGTPVSLPYELDEWLIAFSDLKKKQSS
jgi:hypothetical protein